MKKYKIVRFYKDTKNIFNHAVIKKNLTLKQAQAHCNNPETHETGVWFDGYVKQHEKS